MRARELKTCNSCGQVLDDGGPLTYGPFSVWLERGKAWYKGRQAHLSPQQLGYYELLIKREGKIVPYWYAANELPGMHNKDPDYFKVLMFNIRKAIGDEDRKAIKSVHGQGYKLVILDEDNQEDGSPS